MFMMFMADFGDDVSCNCIGWSRMSRSRPEEMQMRDAAASSTAAPEGEKYRRLGDEGCEGLDSQPGVWTHRKNWDPLRALEQFLDDVCCLRYFSVSPCQHCSRSTREINLYKPNLCEMLQPARVSELGSDCSARSFPLVYLVRYILP